MTGAIEAGALRSFGRTFDRAVPAAEAGHDLLLFSGRMPWNWIASTKATAQMVSQPPTAFLWNLLLDPRELLDAELRGETVADATRRLSADWLVILDAHAVVEPQRPTGKDPGQ